MIKFLGFVFVTFCFALPVQVMAATSFDIAATVNNTAISQSDVNDRMKLIFASSGIPDTKNNRQEVKPQALDILIEEQLKIQEAEKNNLSVTEEEVDEAFSVMAGKNKMTAEEFSKVMVKSGIPKATLRQQIKAQIAWRKVIASVLRPRIDVTEKDVSTKMARVKDNIGQDEYHVAEIFLAVENQKLNKKMKDLADKLIGEIKKGRAPFPVVAAQFSKSSSAAQGGSMGWVQAGDLPKELDVVVKSLAQGQISPPIKGLSGYHILTLIEKRQISEETLPKEEDVLNAIGLQRLDRLQKRHLDDIRSVSFIDRRD